MVDDLETLEAELGDRLRYTLRTVAAAADVGEVPELARRRWRRVTGVLAAIVTVGGAAAFMAQNDDAIVRLPVEEALMSGETESGDWWLLPTDAVADGCPANPGAVLVAEEVNMPGRELNAGGVVYGNPRDPRAACSPYDEGAWLQDPSRSDIGHSRLGFERDHTPWGVYGTFHPTVTAIRVHAGGTEPFVVETVPRADQPAGPRYAAFSLPADIKVARIELLDATGTPITVESPESADELLRTFGR